MPTLTNTNVDNLLAHLFADKKAIYIDDINFSADGGYDVSWCLDFTLKMSTPQWMDTHLERQPLINYILAEKLNQWETYRYDSQTGSVQPHTETATDIETFLNENYHEVIHKYLESTI
ncbi:hypothetical protein BDD43_5136 [Mucilaginibacter gracilis]|uniref:Uncharacterized protein n=1 Tax=Mucilaginibacter gracilis TaxID=423350 RepID=A0A495J802_9SPHI|nr:hypothetical protein [Mucilaginibacter gracilis]RKR84883.1 hypothetical protein BDD43_5136 [Mucilaginibacter gracilis]